MQKKSMTGRLRNIFLWMLQITTGLLFVTAGLSKLLGSESSVQLFSDIGIGQWFRYLSGGLELLGGLGLGVPFLAAGAAIVLALVMAVAVFLHIFIIGGSPVMAGFLGLAMLTIAWGRWERLQQTLKRNSAGVEKT